MQTHTKSLKSNNNTVPTDKELFIKVMQIENSIQFFLRKDEFIGKNSRVSKMWDEANRLWMEIQRRERLQRNFGIEASRMVTETPKASKSTRVASPY